MKTKISMVFSIIAIATAVLLFAAGPLVTSDQAYACGGWGGGCFTYGGWGIYSYGGFVSYGGW
jgi:hypothetical protein